MGGFSFNEGGLALLIGLSIGVSLVISVIWHLLWSNLYLASLASALTIFLLLVAVIFFESFHPFAWIIIATAMVPAFIISLLTGFVIKVF